MIVRRAAVWVAAVATLALAVLVSSPDLEAGSPLPTLLPLSITALWGLAWLLTRSRGVTLAAAAGCVVLALAARLATAGVVLGLAAHLASGLLIGLALERRWRADAVLLLAVWPLAALTLLALREMPVESFLAEVERRTNVILAGGEGQAPAPAESAGTASSDSLPAAVDTAARAMTEYVERTFAVMRRLWPSLGGLALLAQVGLAVWLVRRGAVWAGLRERLAPWPSLRGWRFPFYLVWALVAGLALVVSRRGVAPSIGENVICAAATLLAVQGVAVTVDLSGRYLPAWLRLLAWLFAVLIFAPAAAMACALIGLADQWLDFRRGGLPAEKG